MRFAAVLAIAVSLLSCTTAPPPAGCPLRLDLDGPLPPFTAGAKATLPLVVRNVSDRPVKSCVVRGLAIHIRSDPDGPWRFIRSTGRTTDVECSHPLHLTPGQTDPFAEEIPIFSNLPPGPATLRTRLYFDRPSPNDPCGDFLEWQQAVTILPPANL
jgi:hypothetical protein